MFISSSSSPGTPNGLRHYEFIVYIP
jgi:hypothetical protein